MLKEIVTTTGKCNHKQEQALQEILTHNLKALCTDIPILMQRYRSSCTLSQLLWLKILMTDLCLSNC